MENAQRFEENIKNLRSFTHKYFSVESREAGLNFKPSQTDVILSSGRKCGTTWVAQICHSLRSRGDMDFKEIAYAVPHLEISLDNEYGDLQKPQTYHPRLYKTHFHRSVVPKGAGKYITVIRYKLKVILVRLRDLGDPQMQSCLVFTFWRIGFLKRVPLPWKNLSIT